MFSILMSESGILVQGCFWANLLALVCLGVVLAILAFFEWITEPSIFLVLVVSHRSSLKVLPMDLFPCVMGRCCTTSPSILTDLEVNLANKLKASWFGVNAPFLIGDRTPSCHSLSNRRQNPFLPL